MPGIGIAAWIERKGKQRKDDADGANRKTDQDSRIKEGGLRGGFLIHIIFFYVDQLRGQNAALLCGLKQVRFYSPSGSFTQEERRVSSNFLIIRLSPFLIPAHD